MIKQKRLKFSVSGALLAGATLAATSAGGCFLGGDEPFRGGGGGEPTINPAPDIACYDDYGQLLDYVYNDAQCERLQEQACPYRNSYDGGCYTINPAPHDCEIDPSLSWCDNKPDMPQPFDPCDEDPFGPPCVSLNPGPCDLDPPAPECLPDMSPDADMPDDMPVDEDMPADEDQGGDVDAAPDEDQGGEEDMDDEDGG